ncbi:hypothetical protein PCANC_26207 [Puccinia coronata f. sp. avenae]|uniref:Superoxide dismutase copper/zinc binding domain-containing protein n=1 Tax=Puccinia coronata f. sp. avenae TaxID=200324 RepID=A0A2N5TMT8_9BASI|nr:hypothetical protein PCANC_26207 [Puccinia coronata f. sp. avenae]
MMLLLGCRFSVQVAFVYLSVLASVHQPMKIARRQASPGTASQAMAQFSGSGISATFRFTSSGTGSNVDLEVSGLSGADHLYHIHVNGVSPGQSCEAAGGHWNPTSAPAGVCNTSNLKTCEKGDLSGRYGALPGQDTVRRSYYDPDLTLSQGPDGILSRSIVIHGPNKTRLLCGTIS